MSRESWAFHDIKVAEEDKEKTAFVTKKGAYVWKVMPFSGKTENWRFLRCRGMVFSSVYGTFDIFTLCTF